MIPGNNHRVVLPAQGSREHLPAHCGLGKGCGEGRGPGARVTPSPRITGDPGTAPAPAGLATQPTQVDAALADARTQLATAASELRRLARGIHPAALSQGGLAGGLQAMAVLYSDVDLHLGDGLSKGQRLYPALAATAYFVVAEAVANAHRHATGPVRVEADATDRGLVATVRDSGPGGARVAGAGGLQGLTDRTHALGGHLVVDSPIGAGTTVSLWLPPAQSGRP